MLLCSRTLAFRLDRNWGVGAGTVYHWTDTKVVAIDLTHYNLGEAPFDATISGIGSLSAQYSTDYAIGVKISFRWVRLDAAW